MNQTADDEVERWFGEGGHDESDQLRAALIERIANARPEELPMLWNQAVRELGDEASRIWQEALSSGDASET